MPNDAVLLERVIAEVKAALDEYQSNLGAGDHALPPLSSAEFDFKTVIATTEGLTLSFLIFKLGGSHENDVTNDVTFTYAVPKPLRMESLFSHPAPPPQLKDQLAMTIQGAAAAVKAAGTLGNLSFTKLAVNIEYGVKWDGDIGVNVPISLVTVGLTGDRNKNTVQSVKLTFGE